MNIASFLAFIQGKKTYIVAAIVVATAGVQAFGIHLPDWVYTIEAAAGLGAVRVAISNTAA